MKILLTGGAGYVGKRCLRWLLRLVTIPSPTTISSKATSRPSPTPLVD